jgi:hypothetical protein
MDRNVQKCNNLDKCIETLEKEKQKYAACSISNCLQQVDMRKQIVVEENKKKYELKNKDHIVAVYQVDGKLISSKEISKCDNLIVDLDSKIAIFVELKGSNLRHAFEQIDSTITQLEPYLKPYTMCARIVTSNRTNVPNIKACPQYRALNRRIHGKGGNIRIASNSLSEEIGRVIEKD